jgi:hypothetical protein
MELLPGYADTISAENLQMLVPDEYNAFMGLIGEGLEEFAQDDDSGTEEQEYAFTLLRSAFQVKFGLGLRIEYITDVVLENEDSGVYWVIYDSYVKNPNLVKLQKQFNVPLIKRVWQVACG